MADVQSLLRDPEFRKLPMHEQLRGLDETDPKFSALPLDQRLAALDDPDLQPRPPASFGTVPLNEGAALIAQGQVAGAEELFPPSIGGAPPAVRPGVPLAQGLGGPPAPNVAKNIPQNIPPKLGPTGPAPSKFPTAKLLGPADLGLEIAPNTGAMVQPKAKAGKLQATAVSPTRLAELPPAVQAKLLEGVTPENLAEQGFDAVFRNGAQVLSRLMVAGAHSAATEAGLPPEPTTPEETQGIVEATNSPLIDLGKLLPPRLAVAREYPDKKDQVAIEGLRAVSDAISGLTTPKNAAILGGAAGLSALSGGAGVPGALAAGASGLSAGLSAYFAGSMGKQAIEQFPEAYKAFEAGDYPTAAYRLVNGGVSAFFAGKAAKHAATTKFSPEATSKIFDLRQRIVEAGRSAREAARPAVNAEVMPAEASAPPATVPPEPQTLDISPERPAVPGVATPAAAPALAAPEATPLPASGAPPPAEVTPAEGKAAEPAAETEYSRAVAVIRQEPAGAFASRSMLQRKLGVPYGDAEKLLDRMTAEGVLEARGRFLKVLPAPEESATSLAPDRVKSDTPEPEKQAAGELFEGGVPAPSPAPEKTQGESPAVEKGPLATEEAAAELPVPAAETEISKAKTPTAAPEPAGAPTAAEAKPSTKRQVEDFAQQFFDAGQGRGTTIQSARARVRVWQQQLDELPADAGAAPRQKLTADLDFYRRAVERYQELKTERAAEATAAASVEKPAAAAPAPAPAQGAPVTSRAAKAPAGEAAPLPDFTKTISRAQYTAIEKLSPAKHSKTLAAIRADVFTPGNLIQGYGGQDRVVSYDVKPDGNWTVSVRGEDGHLRTHHTEPHLREGRIRPLIIERAPTKPAGEVPALAALADIPKVSVGQALERAGRLLVSKLAGPRVAMRPGKSGNAPTIYVNEPAAKLLTDAGVGEFEGLAVNAEHRRQIGDAVRELLAAEEKGGSLRNEQRARSYRQILGAFDRFPDAKTITVVKAGGTTSAGEVRRLLRHENIHARQAEIGPGFNPLGSRTMEFLEHPAVARAARGLRNLEYMAPIELPAYLGAGQHERLGLSLTDAITVLRHYFDLLKQEHGSQAWSVLAKIVPSLRRQILEQREAAPAASGVRAGDGGESAEATPGVSEGRGRGSPAGVPETIPAAQAKAASPVNGPTLQTRSGVQQGANGSSGHVPGRRGAPETAREAPGGRAKGSGEGVAATVPASREQAKQASAGIDILSAVPHERGPGETTPAKQPQEPGAGEKLWFHGTTEDFTTPTSDPFWLTKDRQYAARFGKVKVFSVAPRNTLDLRSVTAGSGGGEATVRPAREWINLLRGRGVRIDKDIEDSLAFDDPEAIPLEHILDPTNGTDLGNYVPALVAKSGFDSVRHFETHRGAALRDVMVSLDPGIVQKDAAVEGKPPGEFSPGAPAPLPAARRKPREAPELTHGSLFDPEALRGAKLAGLDAATGEALTKEANAPGRDAGSVEASPLFNKQQAFSLFRDESGALTLGPRNPLGQFVSESVVPTAREAGDALTEAFDAIKRVMLPQARGAGKPTAAIFREQGGLEARRYDQASYALQTAQRFFEKRAAAENYQFVDDVEHGRPQPTPELQRIAKTMRELLDGMRTEVQGLGSGQLEMFYEHYFPHIWKNPKQAAKVIAQHFRKQSLEGSKAFLKRRSIQTVQEGLELGLEPVSSNPVDLVLLKVREMGRYLLAHRALAGMKESGIAQLQPSGVAKRVPEGWGEIKDPIGTVYGRAGADGHRPVLGRWYAPQEAADLFNNFLSPGLRQNGLFRAYLGLGNVLNQFQLGWSAFHLGFTTMDAAISKFALGLYQASHGDIGKALQSLAMTPIAPITNLIQGAKLLKQWERGLNDPKLEQIVQAMASAGGRAHMDRIYATSIARNMMKAWREHNYFTAALKLPFAATEQAMRPILEYIVPRQKLGVFYDLASYELGRLGPAALHEMVRERLQLIWDSVDNRMGQLVSDNLFWNKTFKDLMTADVRSVNWNVGTVREVGGGLLDMARESAKPFGRRRPEMTFRMSYILGAIAVTGAVGALTTYLATGEGPREAKDYFFPVFRRGPNGEALSTKSLPTYIKDVYHFATDPFRTLKNKIGPLPSLIAEMLTNEDFYHVQIRNPEDPVVQQLLDVAKHWVGGFEPMASRNLRRNRQESETGLGAALPFIGITDAPKSLGESAAERKLGELVRAELPAGARTRQQFDRSSLLREIRRGHAAGAGIGGQIDRGLAQGVISTKDLDSIIREDRLHPGESRLESGVRRLSIENGLRVYHVATPEERRALRLILFEKAPILFEGVATPEEQQLLERLPSRIANLRAMPDDRLARLQAQIVATMGAQP